MRNSKAGPDGESDPTEETLPPRLADDEFYAALASRRRRRTLHYLLEAGESTVEDLATVLCGWEATTTGTMQRPADRSRRRTELRHRHLPRLADAGLIDYDRDDGSVSLDTLHPRVAEVVRRSVRAERS